MSYLITWWVACFTTIGILWVVGNFDNRLPDCVKGAPEDVVVYRSEVPGKWDSCAPADDLVGQGG